MADPMQSLLGTDNLTQWKDKINQNFRDRLAADIKTVVFADSPYTVLSTDEHIQVDPTAGAVVLNLEAVATAAAGRSLIVEAMNITNTITLDGSGAETINGAATKAIGTAGRAVLLRTNNVAWYAWYMDRLP